jgi:hypothetical protein
MLRPTRLIATLGLAALVCLAGLTGSAMGASKLVVGISDQKLGTYTDPLYKSLHVRRTRLVLPWDVATHNDPTTDRLLNVIGGQGMRPLVHFGKNCPNAKCKLPSVNSYIKAFRAFRKKYPFVKDFGVWNEANQGDQPTHTTSGAKRSAEYFNAMQKACKQCTIMAADVLDQGNLAGWFKTFQKTAIKPRIIGLHNYRDVNKFRLTGTRQLFTLLQRAEARPGQDPASVKLKTQIWMTETGGIFFFKTGKGKVEYKASAARQERATKFMFKLAQMKEFQGRIKRLYIYHWRSDGTDPNKVRFDAGLLNADGTPRKAFNVVKANKKFIK